MEPLDSAESAPTPRRIVHVDMDAFYASVEQRDRPELRGCPVAVGGSPQSRGVVAAASYEARTFGVRSAMPMSRAVRLCPDLQIVRPDFEKYRAVSQQVFAIYRSVTPLVEPLSLDEAYLDVTANAWGEPFATAVARRIKTAIREATGLTASAGVAPNKFLAKVASGWQKPDGLTVIPPERMEAFLLPLRVDALWGVGPVTARRLLAYGITTVSDLREAPAEAVRGAVGNQAEWLLRLAYGRDDRPVEPNRAAQSCSTERTYAEDILDIDRIRDEVARMARDNAEWLGERNLRARTVVLKVRYDDFSTVTRSHSSSAPTNDPDEIARRAVALLDRTAAGTRAVRLLGAGVHGLVTRDPAVAPLLPFEDPPE